MRRIIILLIVIASNSARSQVNTLKESIFFGLGKTSLSKENKRKLDSIIVQINSTNTYNGDIKGYTCNIGSMSINKMVSNLRALNVYNYLIDNGAHKENLTYVGLGSENPVGNNKTEKGRRLNRRADLELLLELSDGVTSASNPRNSSEYTGIMSNKNDNNQNDNDEPFQPTTELGPEFTSGNLSAATNTRIMSTNGIVLDIDKNTFITASKEPVNIDFKDYSRNSEVIRKGIQTKGNNLEYKLLSAFNISATQEYQDLGINPNKPLVVYIPGDYDQNIALYSNHKNWTIDTINKLRYDESKNAYEISVINSNQMFGLLKPVNNQPTDTIVYLKIKIKGQKPANIKPYVIYDDCTISAGKHLKGKFFIFPITKISETYRLRAAYTDYSTKTPEPYSLNFDIKNLMPVGKVPMRKEGDIITMKHPDKVFMIQEKLPVSSLCEMNKEMESQK
ncbi:MAG: OmpA family protein [Chitinophagales bacterium]